MQDDLVHRLVEQWIDVFGEPPIVADAGLMAPLLAEAILDAKME